MASTGTKDGNRRVLRSVTEKHANHVADGVNVRTCAECREMRVKRY